MSIEYVIEGPPDSLGGASGARPMYVAFAAKCDSPEFPYTVVNEHVASAIGRAICLPIPESCLSRIGTKWHFMSHMREDVCPAPDGDPPPTSEEDEVRLAAPIMESAKHGCVMFDLFVANNDRTAQNVLHSRLGGAWFMDQANALFYRPRSQADAHCGIFRLEAVDDDLAALFDREHHYLGWLHDWGEIDMWASRIASLPGWWIAELIGGLPSGLITAAEADALSTFLLNRRGRMAELVEQYQCLFANLRGRT